MRKVVVSGSTINSGQLVDLLRKAVPGGPVTFENFQYYLEDPSRFAPEQTSLERAIQLLGAPNVVTPEQAAKAWNCEVPAEAVLRISASTIQSAADTNKAGYTDFCLVYCLGVSLREQHQILGTNTAKQPCYYASSTWWLDEKNDEWAKHNPQPGYRLLDYKLRFRNMKWQPQEDEIAKLGSGFGRAHETDVAEGCISIYKTHNLRVLENAYHWGQSLDSDGYRVIVGFFNADGLFVNRYQPDDSFDYLGVVVARN